MRAATSRQPRSGAIGGTRRVGAGAPNGSRQIRQNFRRRPRLTRWTVRWDETQSPPIAVADLVLPRQDITVTGQAEFAENLALNICRVPAEHGPLGSIAQARLLAYEGSADQRRNVNHIALTEPSSPDPAGGRTQQPQELA